LSFFLAAGPAFGAGYGASPWADTEQGQVRLISAESGVSGAREVLLGLQVRLEPGWKFYWRSPGDAGIPPQFDWSGSVNLSGIEVLWPAPKRTRVFDLETFIYEREVVLPVRATITDSERPARVDLALYYALCREICIPIEASMKLALPTGEVKPSVFGPLLESYLGRVPLREGGELSVTGASLRSSDEGLLLEVTARSQNPFEAPDLLVEGPEGYYFAAPLARLGADRRDAVFQISLDGPETMPEAGIDVTLTLIDGKRAIERRLNTGAP
jgi:suppressor for copper-sensitivity B